MDAIEQERELQARGRAFADRVCYNEPSPDRRRWFAEWCVRFHKEELARVAPPEASQPVEKKAEAAAT